MTGMLGRVCARVGLCGGTVAVALVGCQSGPVQAPSAVDEVALGGEVGQRQLAEGRRQLPSNAQAAVAKGEARVADVAQKQVQDGASAGPDSKDLQPSGLDDKSVAKHVGVLGLLLDADGLEGVGDPDGQGLSVGSSGLGVSGTSGGSRGLGSRGGGLGGGGLGGGIGGLTGSKGVGSGSGGYGKGVGSFGGGGYATAATPAANTEHYTNYGINDVQMVEDDQLSTFSVDVDTASYTISRSKLQAGALPPTSAVRVEEFVNYFDYGYAAPSTDVFSVHIEAAPNPWMANHHLLKVGLKGATPAIDERPVKLTFLVDVSGSMNSPHKLGLAKRALHHLVDQSGLEDSIAIATYAGGTREVLQPTPITRKAHIHRAIESLSGGGGTAMNDGMTLAYRMAKDSYLQGAENRVIVLSDGDANIGNSGFEGILASIKDYAGEGITMSTIGFGQGNYKDTMMEQLANNGDGNYYYIDSFSEARKVFGTDLAGTTRTIARDVKIQVAFNPDTVLAYRLVGYENRDIADVDFRNDKVDAGETGSGHEVTAIYDVVLANDISAGLGEVRLRHKEPGPDRPAVERAVSMGAAVVRDEFGDASKSLKLATSAAMFAEVLRGSKYVEELSLDQVAALLRPIVSTERERELLQLVLRARDLGAGMRAPVTAELGVVGAAR
ncbi:MAG: Ca-activated chloride channel family protein [Kiritimatiellia bacterium]|jgi:Ca-activated chloride channel family protein